MATIDEKRESDGAEFGSGHVAPDLILTPPAPPIATSVADMQANACDIRMARMWISRSLRVMLRQLIADPRSSSDTLLIAADALREAAGECEHNGRPSEGFNLLRIAALLDQLAPGRAT